jgi:ribosomal protein S27AE
MTDSKYQVKSKPEGRLCQIRNGVTMASSQDDYLCSRCRGSIRTYSQFVFVFFTRWGKQRFKSSSCSSGVQHQGQNRQPWGPSRLCQIRNGVTMASSQDDYLCSRCRGSIRTYSTRWGKQRFKSSSCSSGVQHQGQNRQPWGAYTLGQPLDVALRCCSCLT